MSEKIKSAVAQFKSVSRYSTKPAPVAGFINFNQTRVKIVSARINYREPEIVKASQGWYIKFYYRIPENIKHLEGGKEYKLFRIKADMNRRKGEDREQFAELLRYELSESLRSGYNPFDAAVQHVEAIEAGQIVPETMTARQALSVFLEAWSKRGLDKTSFAKYKKNITRLADWLQSKHMLENDIATITQDHIEKFLNDARVQYKFGNREYNNTFTFIRTAFNYLLKKEIVKKNPCHGIDKLRTASTKHRYFDNPTLNKVTNVLKATDTYTLLACQTVYYLCVRSDKELSNLKVGNINWDENKVLINAEGSKGNSDRYIPLDENIKKLFLEHGIDKADPSYYVFGIEGKPAKKAFGKGFFSKRFRKAREAAGLSDQYSIYGFKHSRIIHLKMDGVDDGTIMSLTGHKDFAAYAGYLRDLGMTADASKLNAVSRKV